MQFDFLARQAYYLDHLAPIWNALDPSERGQFYILGDDDAKEYAARKLTNPKIQDYVDEGDCGSNPIVVAAYGDAVRVAEHDEGRQVVLLEHGAGLTFGKAAYADGLGQRFRFSIMPVQNQYILNRVHPEIKHIPHPIIGMPKLDRWAEKPSSPMPKRPTVTIAFHHGDKNSRPSETGSAWEHYIDALPLLSRSYRLVAHAHPSASPALLEFFRNAGLEFINDFERVMAETDIYANDCSSTLYEFTATGKPVILLNAPWFSKKSNYGLRFWDYANIGIQVDDPEQLDQAIERVIRNPREHIEERKRMIFDLLPYFGTASQRAVEELRIYFGHNKPIAIKPKTLAPTTSQNPLAIAKPFTQKIRTSDEQGILYMCFGENAKTEAVRSITSLRSTGSTLPVAILGDKEIYGERFIQWRGKTPYDPTKNSNFQFRAGRVKPFFYDYSPFKETLYVDCDVEFIQRPDDGFGFLDNWEFVIAQERLSLSGLYNKRGAGWEHDIKERDYTVEAFGGSNGDIPFWNSGLFFWKHSKNVKELFKLWHKEWMVFQGWDEQKALMRAGNSASAKVLVLSEVWNYPHREEMREQVHECARIVLHEYGKGAARTDISKGDIR